MRPGAAAVFALAFANVAPCVGCGGPSPAEQDAARAAERQLWQAARKSLMEHGDLITCQRLLRSQIERWPEGSLADDAQWMLGHLARHLGQWTEARAWFERLAYEVHGESLVVGSYRNPRQPLAALWAARLAWIQWGPEAAAERYKKLVFNFDETRPADTARQEYRLARAQTDGKSEDPTAPWRRVDLSATARDLSW